MTAVSFPFIGWGWRHVAERIAEFAPRNIPDDTWGRIAPFVRATVAASAPMTAYAASDLLSIFAAHVAFCEGEGVALAAEVVLDPWRIERFVLKGLGHLHVATRANYRSALYRMTEALFPDSKLRLTPLSKSSPAPPYNRAEQATLLSRALNQSNPQRTHSALVLVAGGLGAGLNREDYFELRGSDIARRAEPGDGAVIVSLPDREVPVLAEWEDTLLELAAESGNDYLFRPSREATGHNFVSNFVDSLTGKGVDPPLSLRRLRVTWICRHLELGTPVLPLMAAAGIDTLHSLSRYVEFVTTPDPADALAWMRGLPR